MKPIRIGSAAVLTVVLAACEGVTPGSELRPTPGASGPPAAGTVACTVRAAEASFTCSGAVRPGGPSELITGGQGVYVFLDGTNVAYNPGTGQWTADVTVQNLMPQPLGTTDGTTLDPAAVRVFFHSGPTVVAGSGSASVVPDGFGLFTASAQAYYQYDAVLSPNETSPAKTWTIVHPPTVDEFTFLVGISAEVQFPNGYVDVTPAADTMVAGQAQGLAATVRDARGTPIGGQTVTWGSSNDAIATVNSSGSVTAVAPGTATITATSGERIGSATVAVCPDLALGAVYVADMPAGSSFCIAGLAAGAEYTVVPVNVSEAAAVGLSLTGSGIVPVSGGPSPNRIRSSRAPLGQGGILPPDVDFERRLRTMERAIGRTRVSTPRLSRAPGAPRLAIVPGVPAVGALMSLNVETDNACSTFDTRIGRVMAVGTHAIIMADTLNPSGGLTGAQYEAIADSFDVAVHPTVAGVFGIPSDLDSNGRAVVFYTTAVNELTAAGSGAVTAGFFFSRDLNSAGECPTSNLGEMFYMMAADPAGTVNGNVRTTADVFNRTFRTLAHEYEHLINASRRMHVNTPWNGQLEVSWMDEGLAGIAEELLFYHESGLAPGTNIDVSDIGDGAFKEDAFFNYAEVNFGRYRQWLLAPHDNGAFQPDADLATRGAIWAFLRYSADRRGGTQATFFGSLVNTGNTGLANLQAAIGTDPLPWYRDFAAATYIDDAVASPPAAFQQPSWDFRDLFEALDYQPGPGCSCAYPLVPRNPANGVADNFTLVRGGGAAYARMRVPASAFAGVTVTSGGLTPPGTVRVAVIRRQ